MQQVLSGALAALEGTAFPFLCTTFGAAFVFFVRGKAQSARQNRAMLGFAAGVMLAASVFSLLLPAVDQAEALGMPGWWAACGGFALGAAFLLALERIIHRTQKNKRLMSFAITLHNVPEGMAVGLAAAMGALSGAGFAAGAGALAFGVGIQNIPEGAAVALPKWQETGSRRRGFTAGLLSGAVEPVGGVAAALLAGLATPLMPWLLAFAAGAMVFVTAEELIPTACSEGEGVSGTLGVLGGFVLMMALDLALG